MIMTKNKIMVLMMRIKMWWLRWKRRRWLWQRKWRSSWRKL